MATMTSSAASKPKRAKVLTLRPKLHSLEKTAAALAAEKIEIVEHAEATPLASEIIHVVTVEASLGPVEETEAKSSKTEEHQKLLSPQTTTGLPKLTIAAIITPSKGRRMVSVLDAVLKSSKVPTPVSTKASEENIEKLAIASASASPTCAEDGPLGSKPSEQAKESLLEELTSAIPEAPSRDDFEYIVRHASGKRLSEEQITIVQHYAKDLKYPRGSLVYGGSDEDDFLYCLPYNKEKNVCREMMDNIGYPKLELGISATTKDQLANSLAYNSLKVCIVLFLYLLIFVRQVFDDRFVVMLIIICVFFVCWGLILNKVLKA
jgi:hypothetical protein